MAPEWMGGLFHTAALLANIPSRSELPSTAAMVGRAECEGQAYLAGQLSRQSHGYSDRMAGSGAAGSDRAHACPTRCDGQRLFQHALFHVRKRQPAGEIGRRSLRDQNAGAGIDMAR